MRPMTSVSFSPLNSQVSPPSVDLKIPPPGEIELQAADFLALPAPEQRLYLAGFVAGARHSPLYAAAVPCLALITRTL